MSYVLRIEFELKNCPDDIAARKEARDILEWVEGAAGAYSVKLQKRDPSKPPRMVKLGERK